MTGWITFLTKTLNVIFQMGWECPTASNANSATPLGGLTKLTLGAAGGAGLPKNRDNGSTLYPACIFLTFSMSPGLKSCVRYCTKSKSVSDRMTALMPSGFSPFQ
jgi:hypothetical protein